MQDRIDHVEQLPCAPAVAQGGERHHRPDRRVRVLAAVFAHARHVALYIAGVQSRLVERRIEELDQRVLAAHQAPVHRRHCRARAPGFPGAGQHGPALRNGIDLAFGVARRSQRRAVVEVGATVPVAIPAVALDILAQLCRLFLAARGEGAVAAHARKLGELHQHVIQEETQPHAFAFAVCANHVHAVVPVTCADERQAALAEAQTSEDGAHAVLIQIGGFVRATGHVVIRILFRGDLAAVEKGYGFVQHPGVAGGEDVAAQRQRQPQVVVGAVRAHAAVGSGMPPMLNIAFAELMCRTAQQVLARERGLGMDQRHHVLQLIAEAECPARLVIAAARPQTAGQGLIYQPAVGEHVERLIGCFHLYCAQSAVPVFVYRFARSARGSGSAEAAHQLARLIGAASSGYAEPEDELALFAVGQFERKLDCRARIQRGSHLVGKLRPGHGRRMRERAVASDELGAVAAEGPGHIVDVEKRNPIGELGVVCVARIERAARHVDFGDHVHGRFRPQVAQHPLDVAGGGEPARAARLVAQFQHRELDRGVHGHENGQLRTDAVLHVLEAAVTEAVPAEVRCGAAAG